MDHTTTKQVEMEFNEENNREVLECARYGEDEDLGTLLQGGADVNFQDEAGNTGLHKAAANGHVLCLATLKSFGAKYLPNAQGNYPLHWAIQNKKTDALKYLIANYEVDMLAKNSFGKSSLTEAFQTQDTEIIEICLSHPSSSEDKLIETTPEGAVVNNTSDAASAESDAVVHTFRFEGDPTLVCKDLKIRELPISRADNPFGSEVAPEDDTTGLGLWPASVLAARWALKKWELMTDKVVAELGAGCGLPGLAVANFTRAKEVILTDIHQPTLDNSIFNARENGTEDSTSNNYSSSSNEKVASVVKDVASPDVAVGNASVTGERVGCDVSVQRVNWGDVSSFPSRKVDVLIGSDLVYDSGILRLLVPAVKALLVEGGSFLYVAPEIGRDGMEDFVGSLLSDQGGAPFELVEQSPCPEEFYSNPLTSEDADPSDLFVLHFYDLSIRKPHSLYHFRKPLTN